MDFIDSILLGVIQGLTEFLPVSSSGHLEIGKALLGDSSVPEDSLIFTIVVHFATALSLKKSSNLFLETIQLSLDGCCWLLLYY